MIRRIWSALIASITPQPPAPSALEQARKAYEDAKARGDKRDMHRTSKALRSARHDALKLEVSRGRWS